MVVSLTFKSLKQILEIKMRSQKQLLYWNFKKDGSWQLPATGRGKKSEER